MRTLFSISDEIRPAAIAEALQSHGRVQVPGFLENDGAELLLGELESAEDWMLVGLNAEGRQTIPFAARRAWSVESERQFLSTTYEGAGDTFRFAYEQRLVSPYQEERAHDNSVLARFADFLTSRETVAAVRELTENPSLEFVDTRATRLRAGHFLSRHYDADPSGKRCVAYVFGLTKKWHAEWGGQLQFLDPHGQVVESFVPAFNTLSLFTVPQLHSVSMVAPFAGANRYSVTGWFLKA